jgi:hypothetical protein
MEEGSLRLSFIGKEQHMNIKLMPAALRSAQARVSLARRGSEQIRKRPPTARNLFFLLILCFGFTSLHAQTIAYHGGWVVPSSHVYFIWYGNWDGDTGSIVLPDLINGMNGSSYLNVLTSYTGKIFVSSTQNTFGPITNNVTFGGQMWDRYSYGTVLDEVATKDLIASHLPQFGADPNGVYFLFTSADVQVTGPTGEFCYQWCGYHNHSFRDNINMLHAVVGDPQRCVNLGAGSCMAQSSSSPNDNPIADGMANIVAHEYGEIVTDPNADSWFSDADGEEMGDLCAWNFGPMFVTGNGSSANVTLGSRNFLLQQLWASTGGCTLSYTPGTGGGGGGGGGGCATKTLNAATSTPSVSPVTKSEPSSPANVIRFSRPLNGNMHPKAPTGTVPSPGGTATPSGQLTCGF